jgi:organic hydroperoxide reductase OsmC/OhrA
MAHKTHLYRTRLTWSGNRGTGTSGYRDYGREHEHSAGAKPVIAGSADPAFRGDAERWNPEELLVASLSACHQLWYLHLCAVAHVVVLTYEDDAEGELEEGADGGGRFVRVTLRPRIRVAPGADVAKARALHEQAHALCFIANTVNCPVSLEPEITEAPQG